MTVRIAAAQVSSAPGDIARNVATHAIAVEAAAAQGIALLAFPELSLLGYEPPLAPAHALAPEDRRLEPLAMLARRHGLYVMAGAPLRIRPRDGASAVAAAKPHLGALVFAPDGAVHTYAKMHLGGIEAPYFTPGDAPLALAVGEQTVSLAICADSSQPGHPAAYAASGASVYLASMFLNAEWDVTDRPRLPRYAAEHGMLVLLANHAASGGTHRSVGRSAAWASGGALLTEVPGTENALLVVTCDDATRPRWRAEVRHL